jgi:hypothetical protein
MDWDELYPVLIDVLREHVMESFVEAEFVSDGQARPDEHCACSFVVFEYVESVLS